MAIKLKKAEEQTTKNQESLRNKVNQLEFDLQSLNQKYQKEKDTFIAEIRLLKADLITKTEDLETLQEELWVHVIYLFYLIWKESRTTLRRQNAINDEENPLST